MAEVFVAGLALGVVLGAVAIIVYAFYLSEVNSLSASVERVESELESAYQQSRREMNDAAGQSWRNLVEDDRAGT